MKVIVSWAWSSEQGPSSHWFGASSGTPQQRDDQAHLRDREGVRRCFGVDRAHQLAVDPHRVADRAVDLGEERVAEPAVAVELVDGDVDQRVRRDLEDRAVDPFPLGVLDQVGDPALVAALRADRSLGLQGQLGRRPGRGGFDRRRGLEELGDVEGDQRSNHGNCNHGDHKPGRQRSQHPPSPLVAPPTGQVVLSATYFGYPRDARPFRLSWEEVVSRRHLSYAIVAIAVVAAIGGDARALLAGGGSVAQGKPAPPLAGRGAGAPEGDD